MRTTVVLRFPRKKGDKLQMPWARTTLPVSSRTMGELAYSEGDFELLARQADAFFDRLLTVGRTVDEAAILYSFLENACHSQLLAEAAAANGVPKRIIGHEAAQYTADVAQNPVSPASHVFSSLMLITRSITCTPNSSQSLNWWLRRAMEGFCSKAFEEYSSILDECIYSHYIQYFQCHEETSELDLQESPITDSHQRTLRCSSRPDPHTPPDHKSLYESHLAQSPSSQHLQAGGPTSQYATVSPPSLPQ